MYRGMPDSLQREAGDLALVGEESARTTPGGSARYFVDRAFDIVRDEPSAEPFDIKQCRKCGFSPPVAPCW